jgi:hypothetical protein
VGSEEHLSDYALGGNERTRIHTIIYTRCEPSGLATKSQNLALALRDGKKIGGLMDMKVQKSQCSIR